MAEFDHKPFLARVSTRPGVYQMFDAHQTILYVGKAKDLKKRLSSYFHRSITDAKTQELISKIHSIETTITQSENEALLLEYNLIQKHQPKYNILLRDDRSYPYLYLSADPHYPRLDYHRGTKSGKGKYFGPYPSAGAVRETLNLLQKLFQIRQCSESFFRHRSRPCLQYQIKRCSAPCVGYITPEGYQENVKWVELFLEGKNQEISDALVRKMDEASQELAYERAAKIRDQIISLRKVQEQQFISRDCVDTDILAIAKAQDVICVVIVFVRGNRVIGNKCYFPKIPLQHDLGEALANFISQYYLNSVRVHAPPKKIITNFRLPDQSWLAAALSEQLKQAIKIHHQVRGVNRQWLNIALTNVSHQLKTHLADKQNYFDKFSVLQKSLNLSNIPSRIECFDVSHSLGEATVASCVVCTHNGMENSEYRRFSIHDVTPGDDYGALTQALTRRYTRLKKEESLLPDVILIDGGKGQLHVAEKVLEEIQLSGIQLLSIAKGPGRKAGLESIFISGRDQAVSLRPDSGEMHLLQQIRDEAHRFAITAHRKQRAQKRVQSEIEDIPGIGAKRRRDLLRHFGGLQELKRASLLELTKIPGIGPKMAKTIYLALHGE